MIRPTFLLAAALGAVALAGCGLLPSNSKTTGETAGQETNSPPAAAKGAKSPKPVGPAPTKESVKQAEKRIDRIASSNNCDVVNKLNLLHRPDLNTNARCEFLQSLAHLQAPKGASYGDGAVIDYSLGIRTVSVVLVRQPDGLFHVAFPDFFVATPSVGTKYAHQFDAAAKGAIKGLRIHRCGLFMANAVRELGPAAAGRSQTCDFVANNPVADVFSSYQEASIDRLGGNQNFAFFGVASPGGYFTLVFAHETAADYLPQGEKLPKGAPAYGFAGVFLTNSPKKQSGKG